MSSSPRVLVAGLGGTIAMTGDAAGGVSPTLSARDLVDAVPGLDGSGADLEVVTFRNRPGAALTLGDLVELSGLLARGFADGVVGAVVTQGTDTIEETAYVLGLLHPGDEPIVVTGRALPLPPVGLSPTVGLYTATLGDDGGLLPVLAGSLDGLVIAGFGVGHVPESWVPHLAAIARRIPVVLTSRTGAGFTATSTYGYPGAERDLLARGLITGGALDPYKCRLLLQLLLATTPSAGEAREAFIDITRAADRR
ncbi:hypothetical protein Aph02nite_26140 [Actinoplanes philippinensis]|uniref:asparaginase n=1 Tax=Actinoplanes philippinensis TaxID=35752 RepID=UPI001A4250D7|nr:hypothetical protein Aph02nite_26140 [Actinoplanes philippinensis]